MGKPILDPPFQGFCSSFVTPDLCEVVEVNSPMQCRIVVGGGWVASICGLYWPPLP
jgi:hypothetical protein